MFDGHQDVQNQRLVPTNSSKLKNRNTKPGGAFVRSIKEDADENMIGERSRCRARVVNMEQEIAKHEIIVAQWASQVLIDPIVVGSCVYAAGLMGEAGWSMATSGGCP